MLIPIIHYDSVKPLGELVYYREKSEKSLLYKRLLQANSYVCYANGGLISFLLDQVHLLLIDSSSREISSFK